MARTRLKMLKTEVKDVTDFPGGIQVDTILGTGGGLKGKWTFGWSFLMGSLVLVYEDGQVISVNTPGLFEAMTDFRK